MNVEELRVGQVFKNYKELCKVLEIEPTKKANNSRIAQFKELARYCMYHKEGHKIIIDEVYSEELEKVDKRFNGNNNEQAKCIRYVLLNHLSSHRIEKHEVVALSKGLLLRKLNLINDNYIMAKVKREAYAQALDVDMMAVDECIDYIDDRGFKAVKRAINTLVRIKLLGYKYSYTWVDHNGVHHHTTSVLEHNNIMEIEREVLKQMRVSHKGKVFEYGRWEEFKRKVKIRLLEEYPLMFPKLDYYYSSYHFNYNKEQIQEYMREMEQQGMNYEKAVSGIEKLWSKSLDNTIENYHNKAKEKTPFGNSFDEVENYRKSKKFIPEMSRTKESIVKRDYPKVELSEQITMNLDELEVPF